MTLTIELTPDTERRIRRLAAANGRSVEEYFMHLLSRLPEAPPPAEDEATAALFQHWAEEDETLTPEQATREDDDWQRIEADLQASRLKLPVPEV
jgi:Antitoxin ParD